MTTETEDPGPTWVVHVLGPDDVIPQASRADAVRAAHSINQAVVEWGDEKLNDPLYPTVWAVVTTLEARP